jgi:hypothetical protein
MEERAAERRHVWVRYSTKSDQPQPSPVPSSRERTPRPFDALCGPEPQGQHGPLSPKPSPLRKGRGGNVGSSLANRIRRKTLSGSHLQIGIEFQSWGSLPRPSASCPLWIRSTPFGAPDSQHSIPTTLAHPTHPGTAPDPHRSLTVDNIVIYGEDTVCLRRGWGVATGRAWTVLLAASRHQ